MKELRADIFIVGGGTGGCAAALAACSSGRTVILSEESDWLGGQFTSQATPPDEHGWIEKFGCTREYRRFRNAVREHYRMNYPLTSTAMADEFLNPGNGWVSPLCAEPKVFLAVFESMLEEYVFAGRLQLLCGVIPVAAEIDGDFVKSVTIKDVNTRDMSVISADYFLDATELGDLLPLTGTEFVTGSESQDQTGEPHARQTAQPENSQAFSMCFGMSNHEGEDHTIGKPKNYEFWRDFIPWLDPPWSGPLLSLTGVNPRTLENVTYNFEPNRQPSKAFNGLWTYRILHTENFRSGTFDSDVTLVNYPQIDYMLDDLCNSQESPDVASETSRNAMIAAAKQQSLSFLYFLQSNLGFKGLKLRPDIVGTDDGLAKMPYIRESRRIMAQFTVTEQDVSVALRPGKKLAQRYGDSVGIGYYRIDLHPTVGGDNYLDVEALPFQIPLGALLPVRCENLLPACKNIGTTHITNGCYRLHPVEWNIGEAAGNLAAFCMSKGVPPKHVRSDANLLAEFQADLLRKGFEVEWPQDLKMAEGDPHIHAR